MYAAEFDYHKATSMAQAIQLKSANPESSLIAGGHSLLPLMKLRQAQPSALIDISGINELRGISVNNGTIRIGALTTHREIEDSHDIHHNCHMMTEVAGGAPFAITSGARPRQNICYKDTTGRFFSGTWAARAFESRQRPFPYNEFAYVQDGSITLIDAEGATQVFNAGDAFFIPEGVECNATVASSVRLYIAVIKSE